MISYEPLWKTLEIKGYSTYWLLNHGVDSKTQYNLKHNKNTNQKTNIRNTYTRGASETQSIEVFNY